jgi:hypothetical protein
VRPRAVSRTRTLPCHAETSRGHLENDPQRAVTAKNDEPRARRIRRCYGRCGRLHDVPFSSPR